MMAMDSNMVGRLDGIRRSYQSLTERLADPDVIGDANLLRKVMGDRASMEEIVTAYDEYSGLSEEREGATQLFQEAGDDTEMREMARAEIKEIDPQMEELEEKVRAVV